MSGEISYGAQLGGGRSGSRALSVSRPEDDKAKGRGGSDRAADPSLKVS